MPLLPKPRLANSKRRATKECFLPDRSSFLWLSVSRLAGKVNLVRKVTPDHRDLKDKWDLQDHQDLLVNQDLRVNQALRVKPLLWVKQDRRDRHL